MNRVRKEWVPDSLASLNRAGIRCCRMVTGGYSCWGRAGSTGLGLSCQGLLPRALWHIWLGDKVGDQSLGQQHPVQLGRLNWKKDATPSITRSTRTSSLLILWRSWCIRMGLTWWKLLGGGVSSTLGAGPHWEQDARSGPITESEASPSL